MIMSPRGTAMVTGASSGLGPIYADRLARRGYDVILVASGCGRLADLAKRLTEETGRTAKVVAANLGETAELGRIETLLQSDPSISLLVNNADVRAVGPQLASDVDKTEHMVALNGRALTRLTHAVVPGFVARGGGTIINLLSGVTNAPEISNGVYGETKALVLALSLWLHEEFADKNVRVQFWEIAGHPIEHLPVRIAIQAGDMIDAALADLDHDEPVTLPSQCVNL